MNKPINNRKFSNRQETFNCRDLDCKPPTVKRVPGYLSVEVKTDHLPEDVEFFGVTEQEKAPSGSGVKADKLDLKDEETVEAYFDIEELLQEDQFTEETVACVIKVDNKKLDKKRLSHLSCVYLG